MKTVSGETRQAEGTACDPGFVSDDQQSYHLREAEGEQRYVDPAKSQRGNGEHQRDQRCNNTTNEQCNRPWEPGMQGYQRRGVPTDCIDRQLPEIPDS